MTESLIAGWSGEDGCEIHMREIHLGAALVSTSGSLPDLFTESVESRKCQDYTAQLERPL